VIRHHYDEVDFLVPDRAMSAGTVFVMAGDRIFMNYFSCLGPIDPQIVKDDELVPALSYLNQYQRLSEKAETGQLNMADITLLNKLDLGELYQFEQARELSHELLTNWLSTYKFKDWHTHSSTGAEVTEEEKRERAEKIAAALSNNERWHSHGRMISRDILTSDPDLRLKIEKIEDNSDLSSVLDDYVGLLKDYVQREKYLSFVHTREYF
jgi:G3E family GTPase